MARAERALGVTLSEADGVRYLHFGTEWVQGAMSLAQPWRLELEYQQQMMAPLLFQPKPGVVLQLGLGAAALTKFCYRHLRASRVLVVEVDAGVIRVARQNFALPPDDARLQVVHADAAVFLRQARASADLLQVDLYDAEAAGPVYDDADFYRDCHAALREGGIAAFNLFGGRLRPSLAAIGAAFGRRWLRLPRSAAGNCVVLAFSGPPRSWPADGLLRRARVFEQRHALPALDWLRGLRCSASLPLACEPGDRIQV